MREMEAVSPEGPGEDRIVRVMEEVRAGKYVGVNVDEAVDVTVHVNDV
jgi:hypothetical protein